MPPACTVYPAGVRCSTVESAQPGLALRELHDKYYDMHINVSGLLRNFARVRRAALAGETVVIATRDGNLVLSAQPRAGDSPHGTAPEAILHSDAVLEDAARTGEPALAARSGPAAYGPRPAGASRFVSRSAIAAAARCAPRIDAERFRADLDGIIDPDVDG